MKVTFAKKPELIGEAMVWFTPSESESGIMHYTIKYKDYGIVCSCKGWQFRQTCKHTEALDIDDQEVRDIMQRWRQHDVS
jgi:hypothetical protein